VCRFRVATSWRRINKCRKWCPCWSVTKLASITFSSLAFSYWIDKPRFLTEGKLATVLIIPSFWGSQLGGYPARIKPSASGENYSLLIMGDNNGNGDGGGVDRDGSGAIPHPSRVPEQRFLSPEIGLRWRRCYGTFRGRRLGDLGFSPRREYIGRRAMSKGVPGAHTTSWPGQGWPAPPYGVASPWPSSVSALDFVFVSGKIGSLAFVSSNSENISCVTFRKYKNSRKHELALWHLVNRLVPENA
jgi:hypothetical protein